MDTSSQISKTSRGVGLPPSGRPNRQAAKSVIAAAMKYAADQNESVVDAAELAAAKAVKMEKVPMGAPPGYGRAQTSIFSAFGQGDSSAWTGVSTAELSGFENPGGVVQVSAPGGGPPVGQIGGFYNSAGGVVHASAPLDLAKQCSMVHRMMDSEKNDVDPRDVHKLLPETMMASDSLDLHSELIQGKINQVIHDIMDAQTLQEMDLSALNHGREIPIVEEEPHHYTDAQVSQLTRLMPCVNMGMDPTVGHEGLSSPECMSPVQAAVQRTRAPMRLSPTPPPLPPRPRSVQGLRSTYSAPSPVPAGTVPVTGWPAAPVLGIVHPSIQGRVSPAPLARGPSPVLGRRSTVPASVPSQVTAFPDAPTVQVGGTRYTVVNSNTPTVQVANIPVQYVYAQPTQKFQAVEPRSSSRLSCRSPISEPVLESPMGEEHPHAVFAMSPEPIRKAMTPLPGQRVALMNPDVEVDSDGEKSGSDDDGKGSKSARKFRSLEAALAWCHVQHSQKHVPVVPKDDVKKLVEFQLKNGRPIRAPWYRPNKPEDSDDEGSVDETSAKEADEMSSQGSPKTPGSDHSEAIAEIMREPVQQQQPPRPQRIQVQEPRYQMRAPRPERPRCESAPLVRSWKQPPRHHPRPASRVEKAKPPGTGFFCPPGFEFPSAATPTAL
ncbi:hypothetical protein BSKO_02225 [Bryopsis sp. KO-2023]|nr:hypothetical protein BSKO_02225 [Bryopsis sp. KO-2023]